MGNKQPRKMISSTMNLIMTVLGFAVSATFIVFVCARLACARLRRRQARVRSGSGFEMDMASIDRSLHGMEPTTVASFPTIKYNQDTFSSREDTLCTVCLGEYEEKEVLRVLPLCGHAFHLECIDAWLRQHATCPICRISLRNSPDRHQISIAILRRFGPGAFPDSFFHHANWSDGMFSHPVMDDAHQGTVLPHLLREHSNRSGGSPVHGQVLDTNMARLARSSSLETITGRSGRWSFWFRKRWDREETHVARRGREETPDDFLAININIERDIDNPSHLSAISPELQASDNCDSYSDNAVSLSSSINPNVEGSSQTVPGRHVTDVDKKKLNTLPGSSDGGTKRFVV